MHIWEHREKLSSLRTVVTPRHKPPCFLADPLECCQQVLSVISSVIIFGRSVQAEGQITEQASSGSVPSHLKPFKPFSLKASPQPVNRMLSLSLNNCLLTQKYGRVYFACFDDAAKRWARWLKLELNSSSDRTSFPWRELTWSQTLSIGDTQTRLCLANIRKMSLVILPLTILLQRHSHKALNNP